MNDDLFQKICGLLDPQNIPGLGPGPRPGAASAKSVTVECDNLLAESDLNDERRKLVLSLLLLWNDHLDESHTISQQIGSSDGSYVHQIMHRREPDYSNAKYWVHRTGKHPVHSELAGRAGEYLDSVGQKELRELLVPGGEWNSSAFVDACARVARNFDAETIKHLREIQRLEFELLLKHLVEG